MSLEFNCFLKSAIRKLFAVIPTVLNSSSSGMGGSRCPVPPGRSSVRVTVNVQLPSLTPQTKVSFVALLVIEKFEQIEYMYNYIYMYM